MVAAAQVAAYKPVPDILHLHTKGSVLSGSWLFGVIVLIQITMPWMDVHIVS
jgi:hypothetical protein